MLPLLKLAAALNRASLVSAHGPWSRAIGYRHLLGPPPGQTGPPRPLWGGAAKIAGARFSPIAGIRYASAKHPRGINVVVFPDRIPVASGNYLEVFDPHGNLAQRIS